MLTVALCILRLRLRKPEGVPRSVACWSSGASVLGQPFLFLQGVGWLEGVPGGAGGEPGWRLGVGLCPAPSVCRASRGWTVVPWLGRQQPRSATCDLSVAFGWGCVLLRQPLLTALSRGPSSSGCAVDWGDSLRWPGSFQQPWSHPGGAPWGRREPGHRALQLQGLPRRSSMGQGWGHRPRLAREPWAAGGTGSALGLLSGLASAAALQWAHLPSPHLWGWPGPGPVCREGRTLGLWGLGPLVGRIGLCSLLARGLSGDEGCRTV